MAEFSAAVDKWVLKSKNRAEAVFRESTQRVVSEMQKPVGAGGNMPVDTGFLRASVRASLSAMPTIDKGSRGADISVSYDSSPVVMTIARAKLGQTIYVGYTASYAPYQENSRGFVRLAAAQWQSIVRAVVRDAKAEASKSV